MTTLKERLADKMIETKDSLDEFGNAVYAQLSRTIPDVDEARNSLALLSGVVEYELYTDDGHRDVYDLYYKTINELFTHELQRNPHGLIPSQLVPAAYTKQEFKDLFVDYIPSSVSPFAFFYHGSIVFSGNGNKVVNAFISVEYRDFSVSLGGKYWEFGSMNAAPVRADAPGIFYIYVHLKGGEPQFLITRVRLEVGYHRMLLNVVKVTASGSLLTHEWERLDGQGRIVECDSARVTSVTGQSKGRGIPTSEPNKPNGNKTLVWI